MVFNTAPLAADGNPDAAGLEAMKSALRSLKVIVRKPAEHPRRDELLAVLSDARTRIDRINEAAGSVSL